MFRLTAYRYGARNCPLRNHLLDEAAYAFGFVASDGSDYTVAVQAFRMNTERVVIID